MNQKYIFSCFDFDLISFSKLSDFQDVALMFNFFDCVRVCVCELRFSNISVKPLKIIFDLPI